MLRSIFRLALHWQILAALILGTLAGVLIPDTIASIDFVGDLFLKGLRMVIVPLIQLQEVWRTL